MVDVPRGRKDDVAAMEARAVKVQDLGAVKAADRLLGAQDRLAERVPLPEALREDLVDQVVRIVLVHLDFFEDHAALPLDFLLGEGGVQHQIRQDVERLGRVLVEHLHVEADGLLAGKRVQVAADAVDLARNVLRGPVRSALKDHVLDKMRDPVHFRRFVARARADPRTHRDRAHVRHFLGQHDHAVRERGAANISFRRCIHCFGRCHPYPVVVLSRSRILRSTEIMATSIENGVLPIVRGPLAVPARPLFGLGAEALDALADELGEKRFRARQLEQALYRDWAGSLDELSTLPKALREQLRDTGNVIGLPEITETFRSVDGTERYLIAGLDGQTVETVWMPGGDGAETTVDPEDGRETDDPVAEAVRDTRGRSAPQRRATICVSSQIGCAVNCQFCLTAKMGMVRNLSAGEIAGQVVAVLKRQGVHLGRDRINLVFMGMGEPFLNYDAWIAAFRLLTGPVGLQPSRMTVSTSGIVPGILRFAAEPVRPRLAISLNASNDQVREAVMPITRKWNTEAVIDAVRTVPLGPREKITFEYVLLGGVNDRVEHADEVVTLVKNAGFPAYVNLIVWNPGPDTPYSQPEPSAVDAFQRRLIARGVTAYIRRPRGRDIYAACGQLKRTTE